MLAQIGFSILVVVGDLASNIVFLHLSDEDGQPSNKNSTVEVNDETKVSLSTTIPGIYWK